MLGLMGEDSSEQECSQLPLGWNPSILIVGSCAKVPSGWAPVCSVTE